MMTDAMLVVVENIIPFISDSSNLHNRQGATELIYRTQGTRHIQAFVGV